MKINKRTILLLAAHWSKDIRTIRRWLKENHPMITHPESQHIIKSEK
jgi:hypothetical protein